MSGSESQQKTLQRKAYQLPLKGFMVKWELGSKRHGKLIEGMGDGRFRIHFKIGRPDAK